MGKPVGERGLKGRKARVGRPAGERGHKWALYQGKRGSKVFK